MQTTAIKLDEIQDRLSSNEELDQKFGITVTSQVSNDIPFSDPSKMTVIDLTPGSDAYFGVVRDDSGPEPRFCMIFDGDNEGSMMASPAGRGFFGYVVDQFPGITGEQTGAFVHREMDQYVLIMNPPMPEDHKGPRIFFCCSSDDGPFREEISRALLVAGDQFVHRLKAHEVQLSADAVPDNGAPKTKADE